MYTAGRRIQQIIKINIKKKNLYRLEKNQKKNSRRSSGDDYYRKRERGRGRNNQT